MGIKVNFKWLDILRTYIETGEFNKAIIMIKSFLLLTDKYNKEICNIPHSVDFREWESYYTYFKRKFGA